MTRETVLTQLIGYICEDLLDGATDEVDENTPLLEWGVLNSMNVARLVTFIRSRFHKDIPPNRLTPANLRSPGTIADLVLSA